MKKYKTEEWHRRSRSDAYIHQVGLIGLFYFVPACQLVFIKSQDNQQCFFNYGCARPWWIFEAFNHVFSNIGYIWLGLCFILIVFLKSRYFPEFVYRDGNSSPVFPDKGLPQQNSIFYAMGIAMVFQVKLKLIKIKMQSSKIYFRVWWVEYSTLVHLTSASSSTPPWCTSSWVLSSSRFISLGKRFLAKIDLSQNTFNRFKTSGYNG